MFARMADYVPKRLLRTNHKHKVVVYLIRHGESEANLQPQFVSGRSNHVNLTPLGRQQAEALGKYLQSNGITFHSAYSSTANRAVSTGQICLDAMGAKLTIPAHDSLLEIEMGDFVGKPRDVVYTEDVMTKMRADPWNWSTPNGESSRQVEERFVDFLEEVVFPSIPADNNETHHVAIFGHGYAFKCLLRHILKMDSNEAYKIPIHNTSVTEIHIDEDTKIIRQNDTSHLEFHKLKAT